MKNKVVLLGMPGSGKTTISSILSQKTKIKLYDCDSVFEAENNISIRDFFEKFSQEEFRKKETEILKNILKKDEFLVSTGGGVILSDTNRSLIFSKDILSVYLQTDADVIYERIKNDKTRPLLLVDNPRKEIEKILFSRDMFYRQSSVIINTNNKEKNIIAAEILDIMADYGDGKSI